MPHPDTWLYTGVIWGVAFLWFVGTLVYWIRNRHKLNIGQQKDELCVKASKEISRLLSQMHKRISKLRSEVASQAIDKDVLDDVVVLIADALNFVKLEDLGDTIERIRKSVPKKIAKAEDKRLLAIHVHKQLQIPQKEWTAQDLLVIANTLDSKNIGIAQKRDTDRKWLRLYDQLQAFKEEFADILELSTISLINQYIDYSYGANSLLLHIAYQKKCYSEEYMIPEAARLNVGNLVIKMDNEMAELLTKIVKSINNEQ